MEMPFHENDNLLYILGKHVQNDRELLRSLCLTSKLFNAVFTPFLYRQLDIHLLYDFANYSDNQYGYDYYLEPRLLQALERMTIHPKLVHVKELYIWSSYGGTAHGVGQTMLNSNATISSKDNTDEELFFGHIGALVNKIPRLRHVRFDGIISHHLTPLVESLQSHLRSVSIGAWTVPGTIDRELTKTLQDCTGLASLAIQGQAGHGLLNGTQLVRMLLANPQLEELTLGMWHHPSQRVSIDELRAPWSRVNFMSSLCEEYGKSGGTPLRLKQLNFDMHLPSTSDLEVLSQVAQSSNMPTRPTHPLLKHQDLMTLKEPRALYLRRLCDLSKLEELSCWDGITNFSRGLDPGPNRDWNLHNHCGFAWHTFNKQCAPRLRRVRARLRKPDYIEKPPGYQGRAEWLPDPSLDQWIKQCVAVTGGYRDQITLSFCSDPESYGWEMSLHEYRYLADAFKGNWRPTDLNISIGWEWGSSSRDFEILALDHEYMKCIARHATSLERLSMRVYRAMTRDDLRVFKEGVASLTRLKVLHLRWRGGYLSEKKQRRLLLPDLDLAQSFAIASRSLQYIKVGAYACKILRDAASTTIRLYAMSDREQRDMEFSTREDTRLVVVNPKNPKMWHPLRGQGWTPTSPVKWVGEREQRRQLQEEKREEVAFRKKDSPETGDVDGDWDNKSLGLYSMRL